MKNKKSIYILLPLVLLIWGIVVFQVFSFSTPDKAILNKAADFDIKPFKIKKRVPFYIDVNYRDPFLGKVYGAPKATDSGKMHKAVKKQSKPVANIVWPSIQYKGMFSDSKNKNKKFMLVIAGKNYFMKEGDIQEEILLKNGDKESIYVVYKGNLNLILLDN